MTNHPPIPPGYRELQTGADSPDRLQPGDGYIYRGVFKPVNPSCYGEQPGDDGYLRPISVPDLAPKAEGPVKPYFWLPLTGKVIEPGDYEISHAGFSPQWIPARNVGGFVPWCGFIRRRVPTMASEGLNDDGSKMGAGELDPPPQVKEVLHCHLPQTPEQDAINKSGVTTVGVSEMPQPAFGPGSDDLYRWQNAPEWAQWAGVHACGMATWNKDEPELGSWHWTSPGVYKNLMLPDFTIPPGLDWRSSKRRRPQAVEKGIDLHSTTDAVVWAKEFCRIVGQKHPGMKDEQDWMVPWFANAIMAGIVHCHNPQNGGGK